MRDRVTQRWRWSTRWPLGRAAWSAVVLAAVVSICRGQVPPASAPPIAPPIAPAASRPNILFILVDDMGLHDGAPFGSTFYDTPHLTRLAQQGMTFTNAYASAAVCSPTRAAILTGLAPARLRLTDWIPGEGQCATGKLVVPAWQQSLPAEATTVAEALRSAGYLTASIGKWHLGGAGSLPTDHGFDIAIAGGHIGHPASFFWPYGAPGASHRVPGLAASGGAGEYLTDRLTDEAIAVIDRAQQGGKPFFLYLPHYAVHAPLEATPGDLAHAAAATPANGQANRTYHAMMTAVDRSVGRLLDHLHAKGLTGNTIVVFTSDNGGAVHFGSPPATSNLPQRSGKGYAYEGGLRVPLIISAPGVTAPGSTCPEPVISHDHAPTLLALAGVPVPPALDGVDMTPLLAGGLAPIHESLGWHYPHYWNGGRVNPFSVVRQGSWKLIRFHERGVDELYDLDTDPGETRNRAADEPQRLAELAAALDAWLADTHAQPALPKEVGPADRVPIQ